MTESASAASTRDPETGYTKAPIGVCNGAFENDIEPNIGHLDDLNPGENIVQEYDVHIPDPLYPAWFMALMCFMTCGMWTCCFYTKRWCIKKGCCKPMSIEMNRGKMAITDQGGILIWRTGLLQLKTGNNCLLRCLCGCFCKGDTCDPSADYTSLTSTRQYLVKDIVQVVYDTTRTSGFCLPKGLQCCCCAETYQGGLRVFFGHFDFTAPANLAGVNCFPNTWYENMIKATFMGKLVSQFIAEAMFLFESDTEWVEIISYRADDSAFDLANPHSKDCFEKLAKVHAELSSIISSYREPIFMVPSNKIAAGLKKAATAPDMDWGSLDAVTESDVTLPLNFCPLGDGEEIISSMPNMHIIKILEMIKIVLTLGIYYFLVTYKKQRFRSGFVVTGNRFIEITVSNGATCIQNLCSCIFPIERCMKVVSYYPRRVSSGTMSRRDFELTASFATDCGALTFCLAQIPKGDLDQLLGMSENRMKSAIAFCQSLMYSTTRAAGILANVAPAEPIQLTKTEDAMYPLHEQEIVVARYQAKVYRQWACCDPSASHRCAGIIQTITCGLRPFFNEGITVLTDSSMFTMLNNSNSPWGCFMCLIPLIKQYEFDFFWTSVDMLKGTDVTTNLDGKETWLSRLCFGTCLGNNCCPKFQSDACITCLVKGEGESIIGTSVNMVDFTGSLRKTPEIKNFRQGAAQVRSAKVVSEAPTQAAMWANASVVSNKV